MRYLVWVVLAACVMPGASSQPQYAQSGPPGGDGTAAGPPTSECVQIFQCAAACDNDNLCQLGCLQRGSPEGRQEATALIQCGQANGCQPEASCLWAHCEAEARACQGNTELPPELARPAEPPPQEPPPAAR